MGSPWINVHHVLEVSDPDAAHHRGADPHVLLCSKSGTLGGVELRMAMEARLLKRSGYQASVAINMHPLLVEWAEELRKGAIPVMDFAPAPFMEQWRWRHLNRLRAKYLSTRFLRRTRPDLMHVFLPWTDFGGTRLWLADHCGIPSVISVRQIFSRATWSPWHKWHYREAFRSVRGI